MRTLIILSIILVVIGITIIGCARKSTYGSPLKAELKLVNISEIIAQPEPYKNTEIGLKGKIASECGSGCWFQLDDGTGQIQVDLSPSNLAIPPLVGRSAKVMGKVMDEEGRIVIHATGVEF